MRGVSFLQRRNVDYKAILHIAFQHSFICFVNVLHLDDLDIRNDVVFSAEVEHLLCFFDAADDRASNLFSCEDHGNSVEQRLQSTEVTNENQSSADVQSCDVKIY